MSEEASGLSFGAAVKGAAVGGVAGLIESVVVGMLFMSGTPHTVAEAEAMTKALMSSRSYLLTDLVASLLCMAFGGFLAGKFAGVSGALNGAVAGALLMLVLAATALMSSVQPPVWYNAAVFILIIPSAAAGGALGEAE